MQWSCKHCKKSVENERIYGFLVELNIEFDSVRVQVLSKENLPSLNDTIAKIWVEKWRGGVMIKLQPMEGSTMVTKNALETIGEWIVSMV